MTARFRCKKCHLVKTTQQFYRRNTVKRGHSATCIECEKEASRQWRLKNPDRIAEYNEERRSRRNDERNLDDAGKPMSSAREIFENLVKSQTQDQPAPEAREVLAEVEREPQPERFCQKVEKSQPESDPLDVVLEKFQDWMKRRSDFKVPYESPDVIADGRGVPVVLSDAEECYKLALMLLVIAMQEGEEFVATPSAPGAKSLHFYHGLVHDYNTLNWGICQLRDEGWVPPDQREKPPLLQRIWAAMLGDND